MAVFPNQNFAQPVLNSPNYNWNGNTMQNQTWANNYATMNANNWGNNNPPLRQMTIPGKLVNNESEIVPNDVPTDGSVALFPTKGYDMIFAKAWQSNGLITTVAYVPLQQEQAKENAPTPSITTEHIDAIMKRLDKIEEMLMPWQDTSAKEPVEGGK